MAAKKFKVYTLDRMDETTTRIIDADELGGVLSNFIHNPNLTAIAIRHVKK